MLTAASPSPHAVQDFARDVVEASRQTPVLVDFWAPWCGPCRVLGPTLEKLAAEAAGRWTLRTVNTDEHPELMAFYSIRGIPAVKLFVDGAVSAEFTGALPEHALRQWLDEHVPSEARKRLAAARAALEQGDRDGACPHLDAALAAEAEGPVAEEAKETLGLLLALEDPERAVALVEGRYTPEAEAVRTLARFLALDPDALPDGAGRALYAEAVRALRGGDADAALDRLIQVIVRDRAYDDDGARKTAVAIFQALGEAAPVVRKHRPAFNMSLY